MKNLIAVQLDDADIRALNDAFRVISNMREVLKVPDVTLDKINQELDPLRSCICNGGIYYTSTDE